MVADFFEMEGWNTFYLGANTPTADVIRTVVDRKADVLGISVTISNHLQAVSSLIARMRADQPTGPRPRHRCGACRSMPAESNRC